MEKNLKVTNWEVKYEVLRIDEDTSSINIVQLMTKRIWLIIMFIAIQEVGYFMGLMSIEI